MAKVASEKKYVTFVKGLITEANALTFPENASLDEDNFDLNIDGSRFRRLGIDYEEGYALTATGINTTTLTETKKSFHRWDFPGGATDVSIGVVRVYNKLWFIDLLKENPSANLLNGGAPITIEGLANSDIATSVVNGLLVLVSTDLTWPIVLTYDANNDTITQESYPIQVRDFWGVEDNLGTNIRPTELSAEHDYNLRNQGWSTQVESIPTTAATGSYWAYGTSYVIGDVVNYAGTFYVCLIAHTPALPLTFTDYLELGAWSVTIITEHTPLITPTRVYSLISGVWSFIAQTAYTLVPALKATKDVIFNYPSNNDIWTLGKIGASTNANFERYDPASLKRNSIDNTEAPKGSYVIDLYNRGYSRQLLTGLTTLPIDIETGRVSTVTTFAGRVWYSGIVSSTNGADAKSPNTSGSLFFSQIVENKASLGKCFQEADPTSPTISDLVDTDGGIIAFPEISKVIKLVSVKDSLMVFAENGIWEIYGEAGGFKATTYQVAKISSSGSTNPNTIIVAGSSVIYWAKAGIFLATPNPQTGRFETQSISLNTIQSLYDGIPDTAKNNAKGVFNERENLIHWVYNDSTGYSGTNNVNHYNKILNLDMSLQAFYKTSISPIVGTTPMIADFVIAPPFAIENSFVDVYVGNDSVLSSTDSVQITDTDAIERDGKYSFLTFVGASFTLSKFKNTSFMDWKTYNGTGVNYDSYLVTGYETFGDVMRSKQIPYIWFYLSRTEDGFELNGSDLVAKNQSSCLVQAQWNWSNSDIQGKWGQQFQAYRYLRNYVPSGIADTYDTGDSIIVTKNKFRGSGKALSIKISSEQGKDMKLLGWAMLVTGDGTP